MVNIEINNDNTINIITNDNCKWEARILNGNFMLPFYQNKGTINNIKLIANPNVQYLYGTIQIITSNAEIYKKTISINISNTKVINYNIIPKSKLAKKKDDIILYTNVSKLNLFPNNKLFTIKITSLVNNIKENYLIDYDSNLLEINNNTNEQILSCKFIGNNSLTTIITITNMHNIKKNIFITFNEFKEKKNCFRINKLNNTTIDTLKDDKNLFFKFVTSRTKLKKIIPEINYKEKLNIEIQSLLNDKNNFWSIKKSPDNIDCFINSNNLIIKLSKFNQSDNNEIELINLNNDVIKIIFSVPDGLILKDEKTFTITNDEADLTNKKTVQIIYQHDKPLKLFIYSIYHENNVSFSLFQNDTYANYSLKIFYNNNWMKYKQDIKITNVLYVGDEKLINLNYDVKDGDLLITTSQSFNKTYNGNLVLIQNETKQFLNIKIQHIVEDKNKVLLLKSKSILDFPKYQFSILNNKLELTDSDVKNGYIFECQISYQETNNGIINDIICNDITDLKIEAIFKPIFIDYNFETKIIDNQDGKIHIKLTKLFNGTMPFTYLPIGNIIIKINDNVVYDKLYFYTNKYILYSKYDISLGYNSNFKTFFKSSLPCYINSFSYNNDLQAKMTENNIEYVLPVNKTDEVLSYKVGIMQKKSLEKILININKQPKSKNIIYSINAPKELSLSNDNDKYIKITFDMLNNNENDKQFDIYKVSKKGNYYLFKKNVIDGFDFKKSDYIKNDNILYNKIVIYNNFDNSINAVIDIIK